MQLDDATACTLRPGTAALFAQPAPELLKSSIRWLYVQNTRALAPFPIRNSNPLLILVESTKQEEVFLFRPEVLRTC